MKAEKKTPILCDEDCNHCAVIHNRQVSLLMNTLLHVYGDGIETIANEICPNLVCCADCHVDDFCHFGDDDTGKSICEIDKKSRVLAERMKTAKTPETIGHRWTYAGVAAAARRFGCSREHLSKVLHGKRKANETLRRRLARMGITTTVDGEDL